MLRMLPVTMVLTLLCLFSLPADAMAYRAGVFSDGSDSTCIASSSATVFEQFVWAWTPGAQGMVYVTLRLSFPQNVALRSAPVFDDRVLEVIYTDYPDGSEEWNLVLADCPTGWIRLFEQEVEVLDGQPSEITIRGADSWIRDCEFELYRIDVTGGLRLNDPACESVPARERSWSILKRRYE